MTQSPARPSSPRSIAAVSLGALGVVYGDIGTSPLYAIKECLAWHPEGKFSPHAVEPHLANTLGVLSLTVMPTWAPRRFPRRAQPCRCARAPTTAQLTAGPTT